MSSWIKTKLSYSNVVSTICLFALLGGGAYAAQKITSKDLAKNSVKSKAIKNGQVKTKDVKAGAVKGEQIGDGSVGAADLGAASVGSAALAPGSVGSAALADGGVGSSDLAPQEAVQLVGETGQPDFGNGDEGDCIWRNALDDPTITIPVNPTGFFKDSFGMVHLIGLPQAIDGPGGDAACNDTEDARIFTLPPAYRPENLEIHPTGGAGETLVVVGDEDVPSGPSTFVAGGVYLSSPTLASNHVLDGTTFRAVDTGSGLTRASAQPDGAASAGSLRSLLP